jgi:hypothetical protein
MRAREFIIEDVSMSELNAVERFADSLWKKLGINVDFSKHFLERVNDERNGKPISAAELVRIFKKEYERHGKKIADAENHEAIMKDAFTKVNLPFVITDRYDHRELVAKTVMRKDNFYGYEGEPEYVVQEEAKNAKYNGLIMKYAFNSIALVLKAFDPTTKTPIAFVKFVKENKELYPQNLWTHDDYRNRGVAKSMYDFLKSEGYIINRSHDQTKAGAGFWDKHRGEDEYVWEEEKLDELFQPGKDWKWSFQGSEEAVAVFHVGKLPYMFHAYGADGQWEVEFKRHGNKLDRSQKFGLTGTGNSAEVMSTVVDIMRAFLDKYKDKIEVLIFSAKEDSRQGLYARMVKRLLPDWIMRQDGGEFILVAPTKIKEEVLDEMPLPADWDPQQMRQQGTTFKSRLAYALERAKKLGTGSSRVATTIEYQGRPTVLKIAKNAKGLAQNSVEADILSDGYASQMGILIPIIDYDEQNREPSWVHTELAQKANEKQLCSLMKCQSLSDLTRAAEAQLNQYGPRSRAILNDIIDKNSHFGASEEDADTFLEYVNKLAELNSSFAVELGDFNRAANWGLYQGKPVIIDVGFNSNVLNQYYNR